eukprot:NODE_8001_length_1531_cov_4.324786.p1 GENE.NODE_8001_length_1531_cov_4.324786~~NODE_8001_length_1531_cov_4.324786.p1  ORF type:complete len:365 (-),score=95.70 NODE_8001_length_1531_cov_4.324786:325-1419(-)
MAVDEEAFFCLDAARLSDALYKPEVTGEVWRQEAKSAGREGFAAGSLGTISPGSFVAVAERTFSYPVYCIMNCAPIALPVPALVFGGIKGLFKFVLTLVGIHVLYVLCSPGVGRYRDQFTTTERHVQKYSSMRLVWPKALQSPEILENPKLFLMIPHGLLPMAISAWPFYSRLFGHQLCHWAVAPITFKLPLVSHFMKKVCAIKANATDISRTLAKKESVGIVLDGIAGIFCSSEHEELGYVRRRRGIIKVALAAGVPIVPIYAFGVTKMYRVLQFEILAKISIKLNLAIAPFFGRPFGLMPFGPPMRTPVLVAFGEPMVIPKIENPSYEDIERYHAEFMVALVKVFDTHKAAYGWPDKELRLV